MALTLHVALSLASKRSERVWRKERVRILCDDSPSSRLATLLLFSLFLFPPSFYSFLHPLRPALTRVVCSLWVIVKHARETAGRQFVRICGILEPSILEYASICELFIVVPAPRWRLLSASWLLWNTRAVECSRMLPAKCCLDDSIRIDFCWNRFR